MKIALDAMGGNHAPEATVLGALEALKEVPGVHVTLVGNEKSIKDELAGKKYPDSRLEIIHATEVVGMDEAPSAAIRRKKDSSVRKAVELVRDGEAQAVVSAGNSGATMGTALLLLGKAPGVDRPAIATIMPTYKKPFVLLDAGANVDCSPENLFQFAFMGNAYSKLVLHRTRPRVALMSIGEETTKGNEVSKEAFKLLENAGLNFIGNVEGKEMFMGKADVMVCDGFTGNTVLKSCEGLADAMMRMLKKEINNLWAGKLGYMILKPAIDAFRRKTDYAESGGAPLLGLNGTCIIGHGHSSPKAIMNAIRVASEFSEKEGNRVISDDLRGFHHGDRPVAQN